MPVFERGDVVRVPFPYADRPTRQHRPALVVSDGVIGDQASLLFVAMITSAENRGWDGDIPLLDGYEEYGLPVPSIVRPLKIATVEVRHADRLGRIDPERMAEVSSVLADLLGIPKP